VGFLVLEVVVDRSDDGGDSEELKDGPQRGRQEANNRKNDPERQTDQEQDPDCLREDHGPSFVHPIVGADENPFAVSNLKQ
jgi:hypothetical protein